MDIRYWTLVAYSTLLLPSCPLFADANLNRYYSIAELGGFRISNKDGSLGRLASAGIGYRYSKPWAFEAQFIGSTQYIRYDNPDERGQYALKSLLGQASYRYPINTHWFAVAKLGAAYNDIQHAYRSFIADSQDHVTGMGISASAGVAWRQDKLSIAFSMGRLDDFLSYSVISLGYAFQPSAAKSAQTVVASNNPVAEHDSGALAITKDTSFSVDQAKANVFHENAENKASKNVLANNNEVKQPVPAAGSRTDTLAALSKSLENEANTSNAAISTAKKSASPTVETSQTLIDKGLYEEAVVFIKRNEPHNRKLLASVYQRLIQKYSNMGEKTLARQTTEAFLAEFENLDPGANSGSKNKTPTDQLSRNRKKISKPASPATVNKANRLSVDDKLSAVQPVSKTITPVNLKKIEKLNYQAAYQYQARDFPNAKSLWKNVLQLDPKNAEALAGLEKLKKWEQFLEKMN